MGETPVILICEVMNMVRHIAACFTLLVTAALASGQSVTVAKGRQPQVAVDAQGVAHLVFARQNDVLHATSTDGGATWSEPALVANVPSMPLGMRRGPRIAVGDRTVVITAIEAPQPGGKSGDVFAWRSTDGGKSWTRSGKPLNSVPAAAREGLHGMAGTRDGRVAVVWLDLRHAAPKQPGTEVWIATSSDGGLTWGLDRAVHRNPGGTICECCHPSVELGDDGRLVVLFRNALDGNRDMYVAASSDNGQTFAAAIKLGRGSWPLQACPMDGGDIALRSDGQPISAWQRDGQVFTAVPGSDEATVGKGVQPVLATSEEGGMVIWQQKAALLAAPLGGGPQRTLEEGGSFASAVALGDGRFLVACEAGGEVRAISFAAE
jgi:predicted lipoprotein with Yx(FWY)xxD motif